ncbi:hypothetical protein [Flagellimonas flava]|nr:hypothetical protein [Allomuricauda flava]
MKIKSQVQSNRLKILTILLISIFLISPVVLLHAWKEVPIANLTRDIASTAKVPIYTGFFSQLGIFFWIAASTLCIFGANMDLKRHEILGFKRFLYLSGLLTLLLCFDDVFLMHEVLYPFLGIPEKAVYVIYALIIIFWIVNFYSVIVKTDYILLLMAFFFFGLSVILDVFPIPYLNPYLFEDGFKMVGIVSWFFYFYGNATIAVSP